MESNIDNNKGITLMILFLLVLWMGLFFAAPKYLHFIILGDEARKMTLSGIEIEMVNKADIPHEFWEQSRSAEKTQKWFDFIVSVMSATIFVITPFSRKMSPTQQQVALIVAFWCLAGAIYFGNVYIQPARQLGAYSRLSMMPIIITSIAAINAFALDYYYRKYNNRLLENNFVNLTIVYVLGFFEYLPLMFMLQWR